MNISRCAYCAYWMLWGNECVHPESKRLFEYTPWTAKACELFEPEKAEEEKKRDE